ncbi:hypothetical protein QW060_21655 [Myroides ceti]|uniref:Uncharacterized protein n=1 Tax=Paenimyroides ceti TaxID=395087 RepID=A0ABT8CYJ0_9FLAO|nr:hypothetical protein [Paenimyroides ceti]MDN3709579.1 hypothetical protein [Paenimyroides ceti]
MITYGKALGLHGAAILELNCLFLFSSISVQLLSIQPEVVICMP